MRCSSLALVAAVMTAGVARAEPADTLRTSASVVAPHRFFRTAAEIVAINSGLWVHNRYIRAQGSEGIFRISWDSIADNLRFGYTWDNNIFWTNQFYHPGHGTFFFAAARANGYGYWRSGLWTMVGGWAWEEFAEINRPSINDWINTTLGGAALGEPLFRISGWVLDNQVRGGERVAREVLGAIIAPGRGINRLVTGEMWQVYARSADPAPVTFRCDVGAGVMGWRESTRTILAVHAVGADPFAATGSPFHAFDLNVRLDVQDSDHPVGRIQTVGVLASVHGEEGASRHLIGVFQHMNFVRSEGNEYGDQSASVGYLGEVPVGRSHVARTGVHVRAIVLAATTADHANATGRTYDYGPGVAGDVALSLEPVSGRGFLLLEYSDVFVHSINGTEANHRVAFARAALQVPLWRRIGAGIEYDHYRSHRHYRHFPDGRAQSDEVLATLFVTLGGPPQRQ